MDILGRSYMLITCGSWKLDTNSPTVFLTCLIPLLIFLYLLTIFVVAINLIFKGKLPFSYSRLFEKVYLILYSLIPKGFLHFILQTSYPNLQIFNPSHLLIDIHILHTVLYAFSKVPTRKICLTIKSCYKGSSPSISWP